MGTGKTASFPANREAMEAAALKLYGLAIQRAAEAALLTDLREQRARLDLVRKLQIAAADFGRVAPIIPGEVKAPAAAPAAAAPVQGELFPGASSSTTSPALAALWIVARAMAGNPALRAALLDVAERGDKIARRKRGQRARWLGYFSAASVLLDGYELDPVKDAPELAALSSPRAVFGIRAWYRRALVELDGQKAGEA